MNLISTTQGFWLLAIFGVVMVTITYLFTTGSKWQTQEGFLVARRNVPWWLGGPSIAASWIWAGALFVSIQLAYEKGFPGIFWFVFPNIIALLVFAFLGPQIRQKFTKGFTLPQYIRQKLNSERTHKLYLVPFFINQIIAVTFNIFAGGAAVSLLTGIPLTVVMPILAVIALIYTLIGGLGASIVTDFVQIVLILFGIVLIVPWTISVAGGFSAIGGGLTGIEGLTNIFDPAIAFSLGLVTSIGLISQSITDQQYWQRSFSLRRKDVSKAFIFGAILFAIVPISLSMLGFLAANPSLGINLPLNIDPSLIGVLTVNQLLPGSITLMFLIVLLGGLSSTIDSGLSATASLWSTDVKESDTDKKALVNARGSMVGVTILGLIIAYLAHFIAGFGVAELFLISISVAASVSVPTILSLYWKNLSAKGVFWGVLLAIIVGMPLFIYANIIQNDNLIAIASVSMLVISTLFCIVMRKREII